MKGKLPDPIVHLYRGASAARSLSRYRFWPRLWVGAESARQDQQNRARRLAMSKVHYLPLAMIAAILHAARREPCG